MNSKILPVLLLGVLAVLYFALPGRIALTDPDEVFYSLTAKEMLESKSFMTPLIFNKPQFEKPPLFYWCLEGSFKVLGVSPMTARLIPALCGFLGIILTFFFCRRVFNDRIAYVSAIVLGTSALYLGMSKAVLTDIMLSVLIAAAFFAFYLWFLERKQSYLYGFALAAALAVLTKGPIAIIILVLACVLFLIAVKEFKLLKEFIFHPWALVFCLISVPWYAAMIAKYGHAFIDEFIIHDNWHRILYAEHKSFDRWYFYPMIMTVGLFPWTFYLIVMGRGWKEYRKECIFLLIWVAVTFLIFQRAHSKLASYIVPVVPALGILLSISLSAFTQRCKRMRALVFMYGILGVMFMIAPFFLIRKFPDYVWPAAIAAMCTFGFTLIGAAGSLWKGKVVKAVIIKAIGFALMIVMIGVQTPASIDRAVADQYLQRIVEEQDYQGQPIVTNKLYSRGIYFHTGNPVVVMDHNKQPFWSPHPIEVITNEAEITAFFEGRPRVLCVIKSSYADELNRIFKGKRDNRVIARDGHKIVLVSDLIDPLSIR